MTNVSVSETVRLERGCSMLKTLKFESHLRWIISSWRSELTMWAWGSLSCRNIRANFSGANKGFIIHPLFADGDGSFISVGLLSFIISYVLIILSL